MFKHVLRFLLFLSLVLPLISCGSGGGDIGGTAAPNAGSGTAVVKIGLTGTLPAGSAIAGASFALFLPSHVTPAMANGAVATGVVTPSGTFAGAVQIPPVYIPPAPATAERIHIALASISETGVTQLGEVATVTLQLSNGVAPVASNFAVGTEGIIDLAGNPILGVNAVVTGITLQ